MKHYNNVVQKHLSDNIKKWNKEHSPDDFYGIPETGQNAYPHSRYWKNHYLPKLQVLCEFNQHYSVLVVRSYADSFACDMEKEQQIAIKFGFIETKDLPYSMFMSALGWTNYTDLLLYGIDQGSEEEDVRIKYPRDEVLR